MSSRSVGCPLILGAASGKAASMSAFDVDLCVVDMVDHCRRCEAGSDMASMLPRGGGDRPCCLDLFVSSTETY